MASLSDILTTVQNGVTAMSAFGKQLQGSTNNISGQLTALSSQITALSSQISIHGSSSQFGTIKVDGTTITASSGVISATVTTAATKAQQQAGTSNTVFVTPLHQQDHDSAAKAWVNFLSSTGSISAAYNVSGVTRSAPGTYVVTFTVPFATASYVCNANSINSANNTFVEVNATVVNSSSCGLFVINQSGGATVDPVAVMATFYGRQ